MHQRLNHVYARYKPDIIKIYITIDIKKSVKTAFTSTISARDIILKLCTSLSDIYFKLFIFPPVEEKFAEFVSFSYIQI